MVIITIQQMYKFWILQSFPQSKEFTRMLSMTR